ncbi:MAG TPA: DUF4402 domain-containing protein [Paludibacter sp.]
MKNLVIVFIAFLMVAGTTIIVRAQVTIPSSATAKIVAALTLTNTQKLDFGTMSIPTGDVSVIYPTTSTRTATVPANIVLISTEIGNAAHFAVTGAALYHYKITLPLDNLIKLKIGATTTEMSIDTFTSRTTSVPGNDGINGILSSSSTDDFTVGATLKLLNAQQPGVYDGSFNVMVTYD